MGAKLTRMEPKKTLPKEESTCNDGKNIVSIIGKNDEAVEVVNSCPNTC